MVGIFDGKDENWQKQANIVYISHDYFDEANPFSKGLTNFFIIKLTASDQTESVIRTVDTMFENSSNETKTQTENDFNVSWVKQIGDVGIIVHWILFAVFFSLLLVVGNTMAQSVRERVPELAVLKTLGFSNGSVLRFVLAEATILCVSGGVLGLLLATVLGAIIEKHSGGQTPIRVDSWVWSIGAIVIGFMSICVGHYRRCVRNALQIVDALNAR